MCIVPGIAAAPPMPQTLLALLALSIVSLLVFQQSEQSARTGRVTDAHEMSAAAVDAALTRLAFYETLAFDEATVVRPARSVLQLAPRIVPYVAGGTDLPGNDLDDFHATVLSTTGAVGGTTLPLVIRTTVEYVSEADGDTPSAGPTRLKRATVVVTPPPGSGAAPVELSELFLCGSRCTF